MRRHDYNAPPPTLLDRDPAGAKSPTPLCSVITKNGAYVTGPLTVAVGDRDGLPVVVDLKKTEHIVVGATSPADIMCINLSMLLSLVCTTSPDDVKLVLVDPQSKTYDNFLGLPHLLVGGVFKRSHSILRLFEFLYQLVLERYGRLANERMHSVDEYNEKYMDDENVEHMPHIVVAINGYVELSLLKDYIEIAERIKDVLSNAGSTGVHIVAVSRVFYSGDLKRIVASSKKIARIAYNVNTHERSQEVLDVNDAAGLDEFQLLYRGADDTLIQARGLYPCGCEEKVVKYINEHNTVREDGFATLDFDGIKPFRAEEHDPLFLTVLEYFVFVKQFANAPSAQLKFNIGSARIARIMDDMTEQGYLGEVNRATNGAPIRRVLMTETEFCLRFPFYSPPRVPGIEIGDPDDDDPANDRRFTAEELLDMSFPPTLTRNREKYVPPPLTVLTDHPDCTPTDESIERAGNEIAAAIGEHFQGESVVGTVRKGPCVSSFTVSVPSTNDFSFAKLREDVGFVKDIFGAERPCRISSISILRALIVEVPNYERGTVGLRRVMSSRDFREDDSPYLTAIGITTEMQPVTLDIGYYPNLFLFGESGSGKTTALKSIIVSLLYKGSPDQTRFVLIDPKRDAFDCFAGMPHLLFDEIIHTPEHANRVFKWVTEEVNRRLAEFAIHECTEIFGYEKLETSEEGALREYPHIVIVIDELAVLARSLYGESILGFINEIAPKGRVCGIHLLIASSMPERWVMTSELRQFGTDIIKLKGKDKDYAKPAVYGDASLLLGKGDMIMGRRMQGAYVGDDEIAEVVKHISKRYEADPNTAVKRYIDEYAAKSTMTYHVLYLKKKLPKFDNPESEKLFVAAARHVAEKGVADTADLQLALGVSYAKILHIFDALVGCELVDAGIGGKYSVRITPEECVVLFGDK